MLPLDIFYGFVPILVLIAGFLYGGGAMHPKQARLVERIAPEDRTIMILRSEYVHDRLSLEEFDEGVELALQGQGFMQITGRRRPLEAARPEELGEYRL
jgi:hypothetical protein